MDSTDANGGIPSVVMGTRACAPMNGGGWHRLNSIVVGMNGCT